MTHRIEWCSWQPGLDEADQDWHVAIPNAGVDVADRGSCEAEAALLSAESEGRYDYRVVECDAGESESESEPARTTVQRWDPRQGKWFSVELEIAS